MKIRLDYLNGLREPRHIFTDTENCWRELEQIIKQWATDIRIYPLSLYHEKERTITTSWEVQRQR